MPDCIPYHGAIFGVAEDFVAQFARVAGAGDDNGGALDPANGKAEPAEFYGGGLGGWGLEDAGDDFAGIGALHRQIVQLIGR